MKHASLRRRGLVAVATAATLMTSLVGCVPGSSRSGADGLQIAVNNTMASLPVVVAEKKGFFKARGLGKVTLTKFVDITKLPPTLGKQYNIGFGVQPTLIRAASQGVPVVMISGNAVTTSTKPEYVLMTRPDSGIHSPHDLVGKKLGAPTLAGNIHIGTLYWLKRNGVDPNTVNSLQVPTPTMVDQLKAGLIQVAEMQQPFIEVAKAAGMVEAAYSLGAVGEPATMSSWQAERSWAEKNRKTLAGFRAALNDAIAWINDNDGEARDILSGFTRIKRKVLANSPLSDFTTDMNVDSIRQWDAPMRAVARFDAKLDYSSLLVGP